MKFVPHIFKPSNEIFTERSKSVLFCGSFYIYVSRLSLLLLMHFFEVNIRICQLSKVMFNLAKPENSDIHRGEVEVNIAFEG